MEMFETDRHVHLDRINEIIDNALADMEVERSRVDLSWISRYRTQLQSIMTELFEARRIEEVDEGTFIAKNAILAFLVNDITHEEEGLRARYSGWDKMNTIQKEEALSEYFDRAKIAEYMEKLEDLSFREALV
jgi:hypothetical protein